MMDAVRVAVILCGAFAAGVILGVELGLAPGWQLGLAAVAAGAWGAARLGPSAGLATAATVALGALAGAGERRDPPVLPDGAEVWEGTVVRPLEDGVVLDLDGLRAYLRAPDLLPGDRVRFRGAVDAPGPPYRNEGQPDGDRLWRGRGVDAIAHAFPPGPVRLAATAPSFYRPTAELRRRAAAATTSPLVQALVLGKRDLVPPGVEDDFRRAGVTHVLSVSGLHLAAVTFLLYVGVRRGWLRVTWLALRVPAERVAAAAALPIAVGYTLVTGAAVATVRALACVLVFMGARLLGRRPDALAALAAAALAILVVSPLAIYDPSFQLSFAAAFGLALAGGIGRRWIVRMLAASLVAFVATAPFTALHFGVVQPAGIVANLVVVPLAEMVLLPVGLAGAALVGTPLGPPLLRVAGWVADALAFIVHQIARVAPVWDVSPPRPFELALLLGALAALALRRRRAAVACVAVVAVSYAWPHRPDGAEIAFLDVGQGDAAVVATPTETWLVDAGGRLFGAVALDPGERAVWPFLRARRIRRIDVAVVSHPHPDHYGGLAAVAAHVPIGEVWTNGEDGDPAYRALLDRLAAAGTRVVHPPPGTVRAAGDVRLVAVGPAAPDPLRGNNDNSLVVRVELAGRRVLFAGDLEAEGEAALAPALEGADIVKVPHHGSRTSSTPAFVAATRPAVAIVSCGRRNRFGFPAAEVVARWTEAGAAVERTDLHGEVRALLSPRGGVPAIIPWDGAPTRRHRRSRRAGRARVRDRARRRARGAEVGRGRAPAAPVGRRRAPAPRAGGRTRVRHRRGRARRHAPGRAAAAPGREDRARRR